MASLGSDGITVEGTPSAEPRPAGHINWLRAVIALQLAMLLAGTWWVFRTVYALEGYHGDHWLTADQFAFNQSVIWIVTPQVAVLVVAVVQVGRSRWGLLLLGLNAAAAVFQAVILGAFFILAVPLLVAAAVQWVLLARKQTRERVRHGSDPRRPLLPECVVIPVAAAAAAGLLVWNHQVNGVDQWHPQRSFGADEAPAVLEEVAVMPVDVLENVEGFPGPTGQELIEEPCDEASGWTEFTLAYSYEEPKAADDPLTQHAVDAMRERMNAEGWDVVWDQEFETSEAPPAGYVIRGERQDGVAIEFQVSDHTTALWIKSGCVLEP
jgi:hypothetical protein